MYFAIQQSHWGRKKIGCVCHSQAILMSLRFGKRTSENWTHSSAALRSLGEETNKNGSLQKENIKSEILKDVQNILK